MAIISIAFFFLSISNDREWQSFLFLYFSLHFQCPRMAIVSISFTFLSIFNARESESFLFLLSFSPFSMTVNRDRFYFY